MFVFGDSKDVVVGLAVLVSFFAGFSLIPNQSESIRVKSQEHVGTKQCLIIGRFGLGGLRVDQEIKR